MPTNAELLTEAARKGQRQLVERAAKAICRECCAFRGEPPCSEIDPVGWPPESCDDPGCVALAMVAIAANK